jgi:4-hydroxy-tetrahydrodipicolinate reductase
MTKVAVSGAAGRMGATVVNAVESADDLTLSGKADPAFKTPLAAVLPDADVVVGTTGFDLEAARTAAEASEANCFVAPNFAIGAVLMMVVSQTIAKHMPDAEIIELHHDKKLDAPSGTAARTAALINEAGGKVREPIHSVRLPGLVAHQEVIFGGLGQTLSIRHDSIDRWSFMPGVLLAVRKVPTLPDHFTVGLEKLL